MTMKLRLLLRRLFLAVTLLALPALGYAQEARLSGTITDTTGGVLPGVTVTPRVMQFGFRLRF